MDTDRNVSRLVYSRLKSAQGQMGTPKKIPFPKASERKTTDILIGSDHPDLTLALTECYGRIGAPEARKTLLGWTCVGRLPALSSAKRVAHARTFRIQTLCETRLDEQLRGMWEIDSLGVRNSDDSQLNQEEILAMSKVKKSRRWIGGRYERKSCPPYLTIEKKQRNVCSLWEKTPQEARSCETLQRSNECECREGLHSAVRILRGRGRSKLVPSTLSSETTKVRIVFDSAARCKGVSLYDAMLTGPKLQRDVLKILLRFRLRPVALVADIKEMFPQVVLADKARKYHRLL